MKPERVWRYVLAVDRGLAPHIADGLCTLVCCKPLIRRGAQQGDWIIGFAPAAESSGRPHVRYIMEVTESPISMAEYGDRYVSRRDAIYRNVDGRLQWVRNEWSDHDSAEDWKADPEGLRALVSRHFWYFGTPGADLYAALLPIVGSPEACALAVHRIHFGGRGQKRSGLLREDCEALLTWLGQEPKVEHGSPPAHEPRDSSRRSCR